MLAAAGIGRMVAEHMVAADHDVAVVEHKDWGPTWRKDEMRSRGGGGGKVGGRWLGRFQKLNKLKFYIGASATSSVPSR